MPRKLDIGTISDKELRELLGTYRGRAKRLRERNEELGIDPKLIKEIEKKLKKAKKSRKNKKMTRKTEPGQPLYDSTNEGIVALKRFEKELVEAQPTEVSDLLYLLGQAYFDNVEQDGTPKSKEAGNNMYMIGYNYIKNKILHVTTDTDRGRQAIQDMTRRGLGMDKAGLVGMIKDGLKYQTTRPQEPDFMRGIIKPTAKHLAEHLDSLSIGDLTPEHMTLDAKKYLIHRAQALEIEALKKYDNTKKIRDFEKDFLHMAIIIANHKRNSL